MNLKKKTISILNKLPYIRGLYKEKMAFEKNSFFAPGNFYSTIVSVDDVKERQDEIWFNERHDGILGINLNAEEQIKLVKEFAKYYDEIPFTDTKSQKNRYYFDNDFYSYTDAIFLYSVIRHFCPKQIIEIGSG